ncbi:MAG TPA: precorrin-8X methylmutase [Desulfonatronum sp.]|nr:precorrin-8X methylmutase [Desulfonatronum sp.]
MPEFPSIPLNAAGQRIEDQSLAIIEAEAPLPRPFAGDQWMVVRRMIHASADFELLDLVRFHPRALESGIAALKRARAVITDTRMAAAGLPARLYEPLGCNVHCLINDPRVLELAQSRETTRCAAAVEVAAHRYPDAIWLIGNAPTALLRLIELVRLGRACPALVIGMPVGFVQAAESKEALMALAGSPFISICGRKGGSSLAASALNALAMIALSNQRNCSH